MPPCELFRLDDAVLNPQNYLDRILDEEAIAYVCAYSLLYQVCAKPGQNQYTVYRTECKNGQITKKEELFSAKQVAWEIACDYYAELREKYRHNLINWRDTSVREAGRFSGNADNGDFFEVCIKECEGGGFRMFRFSEDAES